jgi:hypothetical protein
MATQPEETFDPDSETQTANPWVETNFPFLFLKGTKTKTLESTARSRSLARRAQRSARKKGRA